MMRRATTRRAHGDAGTSLILALAFLALLGSFTAGILTVAYGAFKTTEVVRGAHNKDYGADGGADIAVQLLRADSSYCPSVSGSASSLPDQTIDGRTVHITCQTLSGSAGGGGGGNSLSPSPLVITGYPGPTGAAADLANGIRTVGAAAGVVLSVSGGPAFNAGNFTLANNGPKIVFDELHQYDAPTAYCTSSKLAATTTANPTVSGAWTCEQPGSYAIPDVAPTLKVPPALAPAPVTAGACTILFPGKYTSAPTFSSTEQYYLASGVYYFEDAGNITFRGQIFGGQPAPGETQLFTSTPCANDTSANALVPNSAGGAGVEIVLGGSSQISVTNTSGEEMEFFTRTPSTTQQALEGTPGVSLYAPRTAGAGYLAWSGSIAYDTTGNKSRVVWHGLVYAPNSPVGVWAWPRAADAQGAFFSGGLVCQQLTVKANVDSTLAAFARVTPPNPATPRRVVVTATADALTPGDAPTVIKAVVQLGTSAGAPVTVLSWRKV
jgi:hypothetical protein